ncbi:MAG: hypothetical protein A2V88_04310 [Elusimicrobia bacterium RBG_16_66_12]|nr:MAG: hypothetical protein A2V88_04310 [Elusimicrobia bacterium RBG_16_66_12]
MSAPKDVAVYLAALTKERRATLEKLRKIIKSAAPNAEEVVSYGMPGFRYGGRMLVYYAAWKNHCSLYGASGTFLDKYKGELKGHKISKGTIQFPIGEPLPVALVKKLVKARMVENEKKAKK